MWHFMWSSIDRFLTSSAPGDGIVYTVKTWILVNITEPLLEFAYTRGIQSYKPVSQHCADHEEITKDFLFLR